MGKVRAFSGADSARVWEHLNEIGTWVNPYIADTGSLAAPLNGGAAAWGGGGILRRIGPVVYSQGRITVNAGGVFNSKPRDLTNWLNIPAGFQPNFAAYTMGIGIAAYAGSGTSFVTWNPVTKRMQLKDAAGTWGPDHDLVWSLTWLTGDPFPA